VNVSAWFQTGWHEPLRHSVFFFFNRLPFTIRYNLTKGSKIDITTSQSVINLSSK
jgi:hypothetical protein